MCGIAGVYRFRAPEDDRDVVRAMLESLRRRGPDGEGVGREGPVTVGNRRLAILDLTDAARQPMRTPDGRYLLTYNGEIYNFRELREELGLAPGALRSNGDTEVLLHAWAKWGPGALDRMVGQWAFAIYDREEARLVLARDRFGEKPLFYHAGADALTFSSSLSSLLRAPWVPRELDPGSIAEYLALRYVVSPRTVLREARKVPPGHLLIASKMGVEEVRCWYNPRFAERSTAAETRRNGAGAAEEFGALLVQAGRRCRVSDVPVALLLSDGIDSQGILAALRADGIEPASFTYEALRPEETRASSQAPPVGEGARAIPPVPVVVSARERLLQIVPALGSLTEPVGDGAALATWILIREARPHATVFLCGHGGDEVLGGYRLSQDRFRLSALSALAGLRTGWMRRLVDRYAYGPGTIEERRRALLASPLRFAPAAARFLIHQPLALEQIQSLRGSDSGSEGYLSTVERLYAECADRASDLDRMQEILLRTFLPENILSFADSVAMDSSAELRMPYLDRDLVAFALGLPRWQRVGRIPGRTNTKLILRKWGRSRIPRDVLVRKKRAFPYGSFRSMLRSDGDRVRGLMLGSSAVRRALPGLEGWLGHGPEFFHGPGEGTLWGLLSLSVWCVSAGVV